MNHPNSNNEEKNESKEEASSEEQQEPPKTSSIPSIKEDYEFKMKLKKAKGHHAKASNPGVVSVKGDEVSTAMKKKQLYTKHSPKHDESAFNDSIQGRADKSQESLQTSTKLSAVNNSEKRDDIMMTKKKNISDAQKANKPGVVAVNDVKGSGSLAEKKIRLMSSPKKQNNASEEGSLMSDKTEEGQVDINVVKAALLKLLKEIEEKPGREDIKSLIHDTWKSIQLENTSLKSDSKVGVFKKSGFGKEMKTKVFNKKTKPGVVKEDENELYNWKVRNKDSIGNSKVGAVEKHEKAVTYKKEKFKMSKENSESKQQKVLNAEALEDLHKETSSILVESELDEEELLDCRDNKPAHFSNTREGISDNLSDVDEAENLLIQPPSSFLNRDDNVVNEVNFNIQTSNDQVDSEENQFDEDNYEMPTATIVNDEEVALPHAEPAQIDDDIIIVDAKAVVPWYRQKKFYAGVLVVSAAIVSAVIWGPQDSTSTAIVPTFVPSSTPTISFQPSFSSVRQGLDDLYQSTSGDNWGKRWLNDDVSWCSWFGI